MDFCPEKFFILFGMREKLISSNLNKFEKSGLQKKLFNNMVSDAENF